MALCTRAGVPAAASAARKPSPTPANLSQAARRRSRTRRRPVTAAADEAKSDFAPAAGVVDPGPDVAPQCNLETLDGCSLADLELMYIDALWSYYDGKGFTMGDEQYDRLKDELAWQGSSFGTLRRDEVNFVEAALADARGTPIVNDDEYDALKARVKAKGNKRADVTALLLYSRGKQTLDKEQYALLSNQMQLLGIDVGMTNVGCTLGGDDCVLELDTAGTATLYAGVSALPAAGVAALLTLTSIFVTPVPLAATAMVSAMGGTALGLVLLNVMGLIGAQVFAAPCPCCDNSVRQLFVKDPLTGEFPSFSKTCNSCGTAVTGDLATGLLRTQIPKGSTGA